MAAITICIKPLLPKNTKALVFTKCRYKGFSSYKIGSLQISRAAPE